MKLRSEADSIVYRSQLTVHRLNNPVPFVSFNVDGAERA